VCTGPPKANEHGLHPLLRATVSEQGNACHDVPGVIQEAEERVIVSSRALRCQQFETQGGLMTNPSITCSRLTEDGATCNKPT
jgi:hypothetical protein